MASATTMNAPAGAPTWRMVVAGLGVVWYAFGLLQFWLGFSMDTAATVAAGGMTAAHAAAVDATPLVIWAAFAIASTAGLIGALLLFGSATGAKRAFTVSIMSAVVYFGWIYGISGTGADRPSEESIVALIVLSVTAGFTILSYRVVRG